MLTPRVVPSLLVVLLAASDASADGGTSSILGGQPAQVGDFPTVVAITNAGICTGTLIHPEWVLTAAHCILPQILGLSSQAQVTQLTQVRFDSTRASSGGNVIRAVETIPHPAYGPNVFGDNDVGLIRLGVPVTDRPVTRINRVAGDAPVGIEVVQVGYGVNDSGNAGTLFVLEGKRAVSCAGTGGSDANILCFSQTDGAGQCNGDSGGPVLATIDGVETTIGIVSYGDENCRFFGANTRVDAELAFIDEHVGASLRCVPDGVCGDDCSDDPDCQTCADDGDCDDGDVCQDERCVTAPFSPGGIGSECSGGGDCDSGICATGPDGKRCSASCAQSGGGGATCPSGFECLDTGADTGACWPESGCCSAGGGDAQTTLVLLGLGALVLGRRRRRARS